MSSIKIEMSEKSITNLAITKQYWVQLKHTNKLTLYRFSQCHVNTQLTRPSQPQLFTAIQVSRCDKYTLDWCAQATRLDAE